MGKNYNFDVDKINDLDYIIDYLVDNEYFTLDELYLVVYCTIKDDSLEEISNTWCDIINKSIRVRYGIKDIEHFVGVEIENPYLENEDKAFVSTLKLIGVRREYKKD